MDIRKTGKNTGAGIYRLYIRLQYNMPGEGTYDKARQDKE